MPYPRTEVDANIQLAADQSFAEQQQTFRRAGNRAADGADQLSDITRNAFRLQQELVGAKAAGVLLMDPLAKSILENRSAGGQPQAGAESAGVSSGGNTPLAK